MTMDAFSGTQSRKFKFRLHNPAMGLVDVDDTVFEIFLGQKKGFLLQTFREIVTPSRCQ